MARKHKARATARPRGRRRFKTKPMLATARRDQGTRSASAQDVDTQPMPLLRRSGKKPSGDHGVMLGQEAKYGQRYREASKLQQAVHEHCIWEANQRSGAPFWTPAEARYLIGRTSAVDSQGGIEIAARKAYRKLRQALISVVEVADQVEPGRAQEQMFCTDFICRFAALQARPLLQRWEFSEKCAPLFQPHSSNRAWPRRRALVAEFDKPSRWWWLDQREGKKAQLRWPTVRDLAILSVLAGIPFEGKPTPKEALSVRAFIVEEEKAILHTQRALWGAHYKQARAAVSTPSAKS